jgi:hypothetical protein
LTGKKPTVTRLAVPVFLARVAVLASLVFPSIALAHSGRSVSYSDLSVRGSEVHALVRLAEEDLIEVFNFDRNRDGRLDDAEVQAGLTLLSDYLRNNLVLSARRGGEKGAPSHPCGLSLDRFEAPDQGDESRRWRFQITYRCGDCTEGPSCAEARTPQACAARSGCSWRPVAVDDLVVRGTVFQGVGFSHEHRATARLGGVERVLLFDGRVDEQAVVVSLLSQVGSYLLHGIHHIMLGYDHLVFLFGLLLLGGTFRTLLKIVTSFTVAHSITLLLGAFGVVNLPTRFVESSIALTIAYIAVENFFLKSPDRRWILTFFLGLVHGFGFATALAESGLPTKGFVLTLLSFNLGVEVGQVAVVALVWPALLWMQRQRWHTLSTRLASGAVFAFGLTLFVMRAFLDQG